MAKPAFSTVPVEAQDDFILQVSRTSPLPALAEFVWNAFDADARNVDIELDRNSLGLTRITIRDDGTGFPWAEAPKLFGFLGGSWKRLRATTLVEKRALHGREGRGRFKAMALGRVADWKVIYRHQETSELRSFTMTMLADDLRNLRLSPEVRLEDGTPGVEVSISEPLHDFRSLQSDETTQDLAEAFAPYLRDYGHVRLSYQGLKIDPTSAIKEVRSIELLDIQADGESYAANLEIVEWTRAAKRALYLCSDRGVPYTKVETRFHTGNNNFSAYLASKYIEKLHEDNRLELAEMDPVLEGSIEEARAQIKGHFRMRSAEAAKGVVERWKSERSYPYQEPPRTTIEEIERQRFDIVAVTASEHLPEFSSSPPRVRAWHLRMLRQAVERSPEDLQLIFSEVLNLPPRKQEEMAQLLRETQLSSIIGAAHVVADRLKTLAGIEAILFDPDLKSHLKERSQLHRIVADNTWLFGEEFNLMVDDRSLTECLRQHAKVRKTKIVIDAPVKHPTKARGIVDLMLSRQRRLHRIADLEHLVVELKAPTVKIGREQINQVEEYAQAVVADTRFDVRNTRWRFWALSNEVDEEAVAFRQLQHAPEGTIVDRPNVTIVVRKWGEIIQENRGRLQFFQERLNHNVDKETALRHLRNRYDAILSSTVTEESIDQARVSEREAGEIPEQATF